MTPSRSYPTLEKVTLVLELNISSDEDREYFLKEKDEKDGEEGEEILQTSFLADVFDMLDMFKKHIVTINGKTARELQQEYLENE